MCPPISRIGQSRHVIDQLHSIDPPRTKRINLKSDRSIDRLLDHIANVSLVIAPTPTYTRHIYISTAPTMHISTQASTHSGTHLPEHTPTLAQHPPIHNTHPGAHPPIHTYTPLHLHTSTRTDIYSSTPTHAHVPNLYIRSRL